MKLVSVSTHAAKKFFWSAAVLVAVVLALTAAQSNPVLVAASLGLLLVGFTPLYFWFTGLSHGLPIWPAFSAYTATIAAMPVSQAARSLSLYSAEQILAGLGTTGGFLLVGTIVWLLMTARTPRPPKNCFMLEPGNAVRSLFWCVLAGLAFQINGAVGLFNYPGNSMPVVRGITSGLSYLGIFALSCFHGAGLLRPFQSWLFAILFASLCLLSITSLMLAGAIPLFVLAFIGFALGAKRMPWLAILAVLPLLMVLHAGKYQMREIYYNADGAPKSRGSGLFALVPFYAEWTAFGLEEIGGLAGLADLGPKSEAAQSSIFERAGNLHMLLLVTDKTPREVPYLNGMTYEPIPQMLIPRFLAPNKAISHVGNIMLSINYGLLDEEGARSTSIGWSLLAEAYANFGYAGVVVLGLLLSALYSEVSRLTSGVPITSFRFISGLIVMAGVTNENSLGVFITMQFQGVVGVGLASIFLMRRQPNPFYVESHEAAGRLRDQQTERPKEGLGQEAGGVRQQKGEGIGARDQEAKRPRDHGHGVGPAKWGGHKPPKWAPLSHRRAFELAVARRKAEAASLADEESKDVKQKAERPRQVAVPIQPYYYRSRKA